MTFLPLFFYHIIPISVISCLNGRMKIAMLISGGVDSSVSLRLLKDAGHDITAFYLKIWLEDELSFLGDCPWEEDIEYVSRVCREAGVPFEVVPFQKEYWERVVSYVIEEARLGRTPNPDVFCNAWIKFGIFYDRFGKDFDKVATGHYAQTEERDGLSVLKKSPDPVKDQTYFLSRLTQAQLSKALFPIGKYRKEEVRELARTYDLPNAGRKDSQGICFLGAVAFDKFLEHYLGTKEGDIVDMKTGKKIGRHRGYWFHTIGQRRGLGLSGGPWYVAGKDMTSNTVLVSNAWRSEEMERSEFAVREHSWIAGVPPEKTRLSVKIRHGAKEYPCNIAFGENGNLAVRLDGTDRGIASGQVAAFYDGDRCIGSGIIA